MVPMGLGEKMMIAEKQIYDFCIKYFNDSNFPPDLGIVVLNNVSKRLLMYSYEDLMLRVAAEDWAPKDEKVVGTVEELKEALEQMEVVEHEH